MAHICVLQRLLNRNFSHQVKLSFSIMENEKTRPPIGMWNHHYVRRRRSIFVLRALLIFSILTLIKLFFKASLPFKALC